MAVNFCLSQYKPYVFTDSVSVDGHEITNLTSDAPFKSSMGFICECFVRTPVNVTFYFPFNVDIHSIYIDTRVGAQKSTGIEIFTYSFKERHQTWLFDENYEVNCENLKDIVFTSVGRSDSCTSIFSFFNKNYQSKVLSGSNDQLNCPVIPENSQSLTARKLFYLSNASLVTVRINKTVGGSVPSLKTVEIWGQPASKTNRKIISYILKLSKVKEKYFNNEHSILQKAACDKKETKLHDALTMIQGVEIPKDFVDPITCDIITLPILLPSGHTVDQSTLDKHILAEEKWGRSPSDPFTGLCLTGDLKPQVNIALKTRIDKFVLLHSDQLKNIPQTVGVKMHSANSMKRKECDNQQTFSKDEELKKARWHSLHLNSEEKCDNSLPVSGNKNFKVQASKSGTMVPFDKEGIIESDHGGNFSSKLGTSHEDKLQNSLEIALNGALSALPSFTKSTKVTNNAHPTKSCLFCNANSTAMCMYFMPCNNLICRTCLLAIRQESGVDCTSCGETHSSKDIHKINL